MTLPDPFEKHIALFLEDKNKGAERSNHQIDLGFRSQNELAYVHNVLNSCLEKHIDFNVEKEPKNVYFCEYVSIIR